MTDSPFQTTPIPAKIFAEQAQNYIRLSIHTTENITAANLIPAEAYSLARYIEWLADPGACPEPNDEAPGLVGACGESTGMGRVVHVFIASEDGDHGEAIMLDMSRAAMLMNQLFTLAVEAAFYDGGDND